MKHKSFMLIYKNLISLSNIFMAKEHWNKITPIKTVINECIVYKVMTQRDNILPFSQSTFKGLEE